MEFVLRKMPLECRAAFFEFAITGQADLSCPFQLIMGVVFTQVHVANHVKVVVVDVEDFD